MICQPNLNALHDGAPVLLGPQPDLLQVEVLVLPLDLGLGGHLGLDPLHVRLRPQLHLVLEGGLKFHLTFIWLRPSRTSIS